jgi:hypothetical protein
MDRGARYRKFIISEGRRQRRWQQESALRWGAWTECYGLFGYG